MTFFSLAAAPVCLLLLLLVFCSSCKSTNLVSLSLCVSSVGLSDTLMTQLADDCPFSNSQLQTNLASVFQYVEAKGVTLAVCLNCGEARTDSLTRAPGRVCFVIARKARKPGQKDRLVLARSCTSLRRTQGACRHCVGIAKGRKSATVSKSA